MAVFTYHYGASIERGIAVQAQSLELADLPIQALLKELAGMHALTVADQAGEMLSYMLSRDGYTILGTSFTESPKASGYNRSAPCGVMYVAPDREVDACAVNLGKIVNFISFQKPQSSVPAPLKFFPLNESGYSFHNSPAILGPLVDEMVRVALSTQKDVLLVALPRNKSGNYAAARFAIAEALGCLPVWLRTKIRFFTGLPVGENETDALKGFDNAVRVGANVIFCPSEYLARLKSHRSCSALDLEKPSAAIGAFAQHITRVSDISANLSMVNNCLAGAKSYDALNKAAQCVQRGDIVTVDMLQMRIAKAEAKVSLLEQQLGTANADNGKLTQKLADCNTLWEKRYNDLKEIHQKEREESAAKYRQVCDDNVYLKNEYHRMTQTNAVDHTQAFHVSGGKYDSREAAYNPHMHTRAEFSTHNMPERQDYYTSRQPMINQQEPVKNRSFAQTATERKSKRALGQKKTRVRYWVLSIFCAILLVITTAFMTILAMEFYAEKSDALKKEKSTIEQFEGNTGEETEMRMLELDEDGKNGQEESEPLSDKSEKTIPSSTEEKSGTNSK